MLTLGCASSNGGWFLEVAFQRTRNPFEELRRGRLPPIGRASISGVGFEAVYPSHAETILAAVSIVAVAAVAPSNAACQCDAKLKRW